MSKKALTPGGVFDKTLGQQVSSLATNFFCVVVVIIALFASYNKDAHQMAIPSLQATIYMVASVILFAVAIKTNLQAKKDYEQYRTEGSELRKDSIVKKVKMHSTIVRALILSSLLLTVLAMMMANKVSFEDAANGINSLLAKLK